MLTNDHVLTYKDILAQAKKREAAARKAKKLLTDQRFKK